MSKIRELPAFVWESVLINTNETYPWSRRTYITPDGELYREAYGSRSFSKTKPTKAFWEYNDINYKVIMRDNFPDTFITMWNKYDETLTDNNGKKDKRSMG